MEKLTYLFEDMLPEVIATLGHENFVENILSYIDVLGSFDTCWKVSFALIKVIVVFVSFPVVAAGSMNWSLIGLIYVVAFLVLQFNASKLGEP